LQQAPNRPYGILGSEWLPESSPTELAGDD